jgi:glycosyltransferase involved in cell wall biosynthesis
MNEEVSISVVIPTHNRLEELRRAILSVVKQDYVVEQIWIIDDASTQDISILKEEFVNHPILYHRLSEKSNANVARNKGAELSNADYIAFLDSDDEWESNHLSLFVENIDCQFQGYFGGAKISRNFGDVPSPKLSISLSELESPMDFLLGGGFAQTSSFIIERTAFLQCRFDPILKRHQDFDFFVRFYQQFRWKQLQHSSVIVHWEEGRAITRDAATEMIVMKKYRGMIDPKLYHRYLFIQYDYFLKNGQNQFLSLYQNELVYISRMLSFPKFCTFHQEKKGILGKLQMVVLFAYLKLKAAWI